MRDGTRRNSQEPLNQLSRLRQICKILRDIRTSNEPREVDWSPPRLVSAERIRACCSKERDDLTTAARIEHGCPKWCVAECVHRIHGCSAFEKETHDLGAKLLGSEVKGDKSLAIRGVRIRPLRQ